MNCSSAVSLVLFGYGMYIKIGILLSDDHDLHGAGASACLIPVYKVDPSEFSQIGDTVIDHNGNATSDNGRPEVRVGVVASKIVLSVLFGKLQGLGTGMKIHILVSAGRDPVFKSIDKILLKSLEPGH